MSYIYSIINKSNNKIYIGKTVSIDIRKKEHLRKLKYGKHINKHLQNSFDKYGENSFIFNIIEECEDLIINEREKYWINYYNSTNQNIGYNLMLGGEGGIGTIETRHKQSLSQDKNKKKVYGFSKDGIFYKSWNSIKNCSEELLVNRCDIKRTIKQKQYSCKGFILQDINVFDNRITPSQKLKLRIRNLNGTFK